MHHENASLWQDLFAAWREGDWTTGADLLRPVVDRFPDVLTTRFMLATLHLRADAEQLAIVQYEKLLVLAVGQGKLFHALAAQRRLDDLRPPGATHAKRFAAIQQWFRAIPARRGKNEPGGRLTPDMLLKLPPGEFSAIGESLKVDPIEGDPRTFTGPDAMLEVLLWGRVRWVLEPEGESPLPAVVAEAADTLCAPPGTQPNDRLHITPEQPSEVLSFDRPFVASLRNRIHAEAQAKRAKLGHRGPRKPAPEAVEPAEASGAQPSPDPAVEPLHANAFPRERRHEHRVGIDFASGVARLGLAGSRIAPFTGRLVEISPAGIGLAFPGGSLRQARRELEGSVANLYLRLPNLDEALRLGARITAIAYETAGAPTGGGGDAGQRGEAGGAARSGEGDGEQSRGEDGGERRPGGAGGEPSCEADGRSHRGDGVERSGVGGAASVLAIPAPQARLSLEFPLLLAADRAVIQEAMIGAARVGQWPGFRVDPMVDDAEEGSHAGGSPEAGGAHDALGVKAAPGSGEPEARAA